MNVFFEQNNFGPWVLKTWKLSNFEIEGSSFLGEFVCHASEEISEGFLLFWDEFFEAFLGLFKDWDAFIQSDVVEVPIGWEVDHDTAALVRPAFLAL